MNYWQPIAILGLLLTALVPRASAQGYVWQPLSADDVTQSVRNFEGDPALAVKVVETPPGSTASTAPAPWISYVLAAGDYRYTVCAYSRDMFIRDDMTFLLEKPTFYGQPYDLDALKQQAMSQSAAQSIARAFMLAHFPHPEVLTQTMVWPEFEHDKMTGNPVFINDYEICYFQQAANGAEGPAECYVTVDTVKGQVVKYSGRSFPLLIGTTPTLRADQATASAMNALNIVQGTPKPATGLMVSVPDAFGNETLLYDVRFIGISLPPGQTDTTDVYPENYTATVDAFTGNVVHTDMLMKLMGHYKSNEPPSFSSTRKRLARKLKTTQKQLQFVWAGQPSKINYSPLYIGGAAYMCADYLCYRSPDAKITAKKDGYFHVSGRKRVLDFRLDSQSYRFNGQPKRMSTKPVLVNGRYYVPLDVMQAVLPGKWRYDTQAQTVYYDPPQIRQGTREWGRPTLTALVLSSGLLTLTWFAWKQHDSASLKKHS